MTITENLLPEDYHATTTDLAALTREELSALSSLVCNAWYAQDGLRAAGYDATAEANERAADVLHAVLIRTGIWTERNAA